MYRVKSDDDNMKKVLKEAKDNGKVKVSINNKEQEYGAKVNGDFLFLYDTNADWNDVVTAFPNYTYAGTGTTGTNGTNGVSEPPIRGLRRMRMSRTAMSIHQMMPKTEWKTKQLI